MKRIHVNPPRHRESSLRVHALVEYTKSSSWLRVFVVCSTALLPAFTFTILLELLPVHVPSEGWKANWVFWIRLFLSNVMISAGTAAQLANLVPAAGLAPKHIFLMAVIASVVFEAPLLVLAECWRFPVPFSSMIASPGWFASMVICAVSIVGLQKWQENHAIQKQMDVAIKMAVAQSFLVMIYPMYNAAFLRLNGLAQTASILVLPVIKFGMNAVIFRLSIGTPAAGAIGIVTVELFDALYLFKCMQTAGSMLSGIGLIIVDLMQNIYHVWILHKHTAKLMRDMGNDELSTATKHILRTRFAKLKALQSKSPLAVAKNTVVPGPRSGNWHMSKIAVKSISKTDDISVLGNVLQELLVECEHIVLVEFIECSVPLFYAIYMTILFHLPNAKFYPEMEHMDSIKLTHTARNIAAYAAMEFASLVYMHVVLQWKFNISALHMLANLLERERKVIQGVFVTWVIVVLQLTLQHSGTWICAFVVPYSMAWRADKFL